MSRLVAPSILAVWDSSNGDYDTVIAKGIEAIAAGADLLHVDIMDGIAVPAKTFGCEMILRLKEAVGLDLLDIHLMVEDAGQWMADLESAGVKRAVFHPFSLSQHGECKESRWTPDVQVGIALDVDEGPELLEPYLGKIDQVLLMTVKAGAGGQAFMPAMLEKVRTVRAMCGPEVRIVVDGGVKREVAAACWEAGADVLVAGSAVFGKPDLKEAIEALR